MNPSQGSSTPCSLFFLFGWHDQTTVTQSASAVLQLAIPNLLQDVSIFKHVPQSDPKDILEVLVHVESHNLL